MANRQQKILKRLGLRSVNGGPSTTISAVVHGSGAFRSPDLAIRFKKEHNIGTWKVTKRHPANTQKQNKDKGKNNQY